MWYVKFQPKMRWERCVCNKSKYGLVKSTNHTLKFPILLGSVRAREAEE